MLYVVNRLILSIRLKVRVEERRQAGLCVRLCRA
jgi:hypothetical protein